MSNWSGSCSNCCHLSGSGCWATSRLCRGRDILALADLEVLLSSGELAVGLSVLAGEAAPQKERLVEQLQQDNAEALAQQGSVRGRGGGGSQTDGWPAADLAGEPGALVIKKTASEAFCELALMHLMPFEAQL